MRLCRQFGYCAILVSGIFIIYYTCTESNLFQVESLWSPFKLRVSGHHLCTFKGTHSKVIARKGLLHFFNVTGIQGLYEVGSDARRRARRRVATGLERGGAKLLRSAAQDRKLGPARRMPESA